MALTLKVDAGGTKTRIWLIDSKNRTVNSKVYPSNPAELKTQIKKFLNAKKFNKGKALLGLRGVWTAPEKQIWRFELNSLLPNLKVMSDVELKYHEVFGNGPGILLNAGTGSIAIGRKKGKPFVRAGGLGPLLGDEGSAFWIGKRVLFEKFARQGNWRPVRNLAQSPDVIKKTARLGGQTVKQGRTPIINAAQEHLLKLVQLVQNKIRLRPCYVRVVGGLFKNRSFYIEFQARLRKKGFIILN